MTPIVVTAEFAFTEEGEAAFLANLERTMAEVRGIDGCLQAVLWSRPGRRYQFSTTWSDSDAVTRWVENDYHQKVLMPGFRRWCTEGCFGEYVIAAAHERARKCAECGRWTRMLPGWDESEPSVCRACGDSLHVPRT